MDDLVRRNPMPFDGRGRPSYATVFRNIMEHKPQADWREPMNDNRSNDEFGAIDIVEAFTALRHDLKLQIRSGTETQQMLNQRLDKLERLVQNPPHALGEIPDSEARRLALALVETEDALQRAVDGLQRTPKTTHTNGGESAGHQLKLEIESAGWLVRKTAPGLLQRLRGLADELEQSQAASEGRIGLAEQGLDLLLERTRRLMRERQIERRNVSGLAFDSSLMNAIEAVATEAVPPGHVAEQLKPAYLWRKQVLCFAEVRVASTNS